MFSIFETPLFITVIIMFYIVFFFALFIIKLPRENGKQQMQSKKSEKITQVAQEYNSDCTMFGFLQTLPKGEAIPDECMSCQKLLECLLKKNAYEWYSGRDSSKKSEP